jgi:hypothetical protein
MILASALKVIFDSIPDDQWVDLWLTDGTGGGVAVADIQMGEEMGVNASVNVIFPTGYFLTTEKP